MKKRKNVVIYFGIFVIIVLLVLYNNFVIIRNIKFCDDSVGIIDTYISEKYDNVIEKNAVVHGKKIKHGDLLIEFLRDCGYNGQIYYYAAIDQDNRITSKTILEGLEWMKKMGVKRINLSVSASVYNEELERWIEKNDDIQIYASYSNLKNSIDYPAMYKNVIGCGYAKGELNKAIDNMYKSNRIIVWNNGLAYYKGNSYLSLYTMLKKA